MATRKGLGISVKMILTTTVLILGTVLGFGMLKTCSIQDAYDQGAKEKIEGFRESLRTKGAVTTQVFGKAPERYLIDNADAEIVSAVANTVKQDEGLSMVYVLSRDQNQITFCKVQRGRPDPCDRGGYPPEMHVPVKHASWARIVDTWKQTAAAGKADTRVTFELEPGDGLCRIHSRWAEHVAHSISA